MKKLTVILSMSLCVAFLATGCGFSDGVKQGIDDAMSQTEQTKEETTEPEKETVEPETTAPETEEVESQTAESDNPLVAAEQKVSDVMNGTGTDKLGEWMEVSVPHATLENMPMEQFVEFCTSVVDGSGYNWVTINCGGNKGIQFTGSDTTMATYGDIDTDGCITKADGYIIIQEDGTYEYQKAE